MTAPIQVLHLLVTTSPGGGPKHIYSWLGRRLYLALRVVTVVTESPISPMWLRVPAAARAVPGLRLRKGSRPLLSVHLGDELAKLRCKRGIEPVHPSAETLLADRADLIHGDLRPPARTHALDAASPPRVKSGSERAHDNGVEVAIHRGEAHHDHGAGLRDLAAAGGIEVGEIDAVPLNSPAHQGSWPTITPL